MAIQMVRLISGNNSLYGYNPSTIAELIAERLNSLTNSGFIIVGVAAVPDFHNFGADGGVKDIFFMVKKGEDVKHGMWKVALVLSDRSTFHGTQSDSILQRVQNVISELEQAGKTVRHMVMLTDHHNFTVFSGVGGRDGLKNVLICYQE